MRWLIAPTAGGSLKRKSSGLDGGLRSTRRHHHRAEGYVLRRTARDARRVSPIPTARRCGRSPIDALRALGIETHARGTVVVISGPRFSTRAESKLYQSQGWEVINMTQYPGVLSRARTRDVLREHLPDHRLRRRPGGNRAGLASRRSSKCSNRTTNASKRPSAKSSSASTSTPTVRASTRWKEPGSKCMQALWTSRCTCAAVPLLFRHLSILAVPLLAAVVDVLIDQLSPLLTNAVGGAGAGIFLMLVQLVYLWAFGVAIIQASNIWRGRRGSFDEAWDESRAKFGGLLLAAIGFQFVVWAASYIGSFVAPMLGLALGAVAAFFLIYTIPAAAIGGMPGSLAISASMRGVRANVRVVADTRDRLLRAVVSARAGGAAVCIAGVDAAGMATGHGRRARAGSRIPGLPVCQAVRRHRVYALLVRRPATVSAMRTISPTIAARHVRACEPRGIARALRAAPRRAQAAAGASRRTWFA